MARVPKRSGRKAKAKANAKPNTKLGTKARKASPAKGRNAATKKRAEPSTRKKGSSVQTRLKLKSRELNEALAQQAATAEILRVIASSPSDVQPVFEAIVRTAVRLLGCDRAFFMRVDGDVFTPVAAESRDGPTPLGPANQPVDSAVNFPSRAIATKQMLYLPDWNEIELPPYERAIHDRFGVKSSLFLPLVRGHDCIGLLVMVASRPHMFGQTAIALAESFCDQALIAIENARLFNETRQALERQTASADILKVIASSPTDVQPVFETIAQTAVRLLGCDRAYIQRCDDRNFWTVAACGPEGQLPTINHAPNPINPAANFPSRAIVEQKVLYLPDWSKIELPEFECVVRDRLGISSTLYLPLLRGGECIGVLIMAGRRANAFDAKDIALAESFRDQALIAIENTRLFNETREALEQQRASASVLSAISHSVSDTQPVFDEILQSVAHLFGSQENYVFLVGEGDLLHVGAGSGPRLEQVRTIFPAPLEGTVSEVAIREGRLVRSANVFEDPELPLPARERYRRLGENYAMVVAPMLWEGRAIGSIMVARTSMVAFSDKECGLLRTFADQAVIAIENARLFDQVQSKSRNLEESLQQQTATADVLKVISRSAFDLRAVLVTLVNSARDLCNAPIGTFFLREGDVFKLATEVGCPPELREYFARTAVPVNLNTGAGRVFSTGKLVHLPDVLADPDYRFSEGQRLGGYRSLLSVPLLSLQEVIGVFTLARFEPEPFTQSQIDLVTTFADQAVIAIQNVRLFDEVQSKTHDLQESLQQQTATSEVLQVISSSPSNLAPVFESMLKNATLVCGAEFGSMNLVEDGWIRQVALFNPPAAFAAARAKGGLYRAHPQSSLASALESKQVIQVADLRTAGAYVERWPNTVELVELGGARTVVVVPLLRENEVIGVITIFRQEVRPFEDKQIELVRNFARQAVIAIENARLLGELRQRTADLSKSLDDLRTAQDRLVQTEKLASLGQLTAGIAHEIKNPLNFVNNFSSLSAELVDELDETLAPAPLDEKMRGDVGELTGMLKSNLEKVVAHGKRADSIVKNMLQHSRESSGEQRSADINALVEESLNLAYHGARAEKPGFTITLRPGFDPDAGTANLYPQEITRALLNLISNGFYAAIRRKAESGDGNFEPMLSASTRNLGNAIEIRIRDNGTGILPEVREKMFNPFFTTKPTGEGTGLGLSMTHDIIVKQHGGQIDVETEPGVFTEFIVTLPRGSAVR